MLRFALLLVVILPGFAWTKEVSRQVVVSATGVAEATPDMAEVIVGVSREARTATEALQSMSDAAQSVLDEVSSAGIEARDVQTASVNLNPVWEAGNTRPPQIRGYAASTTLAVRVRDLNQLGTLLDTVVGGGANQLNRLSFDVADIEPVEDAARADAVKRALRRAETLAAAAGVSLGPIQTIQEGGVGARSAPMMRGAMLEAASVPIASGELNVRVTVTVTFDILE